MSKKPTDAEQYKRIGKALFQQYLDIEDNPLDRATALKIAKGTARQIVKYINIDHSQGY